MKKIRMIHKKPGSVYISPEDIVKAMPPYSDRRSNGIIFIQSDIEREDGLWYAVFYIITL